MQNWHTQTIEDLTHELGTDLEKGLTQEEAARRLEQYGPNELVERGVTSPWKILWEQLTGILVIILIISAVISFCSKNIRMHHHHDHCCAQCRPGLHPGIPRRAGDGALKKMSTPRVKVRRAGRTQEIPAQELVPGDVILLEAGNVLSADCRLAESANLRVQIRAHRRIGTRGKASARWKSSSCRSPIAATCSTWARSPPMGAAAPLSLPPA